MTDSLTHELDALGHQLFNRAISCARRARGGCWEIDPNAPHEDEHAHKAFLLELLRAELASPEMTHRNAVINQSIADTTTMQLDEGNHDQQPKP